MYGVLIHIGTFLLSMLLLFVSGKVQSQEPSTFPADSTHPGEDGFGSEVYSFLSENQEVFLPTRMEAPVYIKLFDHKAEKYWAPPLLNTKQKTSNFGMRWGKFHHGIDLALRTGAPVMSVFDGVIKISSYGKGYGNYVLIQHDNGLETLYAHLYTRKVSPGQRVQAGDLIGLGGNTGFSTGPHLHFEVRYRGYTINPLLIYDFQKEYQIRSEKFFLQPHHFKHYGNAIQRKHYVFYEVGQNETLEIIATRYQINQEEIIRLNQLTSSKLQSGQIIRLK